MNFSQFSFACYWLVLLADFRETFSQGTSAARMSPLRIRRGVVCSTRPSHVFNLPVRAAAPISWCTSLSFVRARPFEFLRTRSRHRGYVTSDNCGQAHQTSFDVEANAAVLRATRHASRVFDTSRNFASRRNRGHPDTCVRRLLRYHISRRSLVRGSYSAAFRHSRK